MINLAEIPVKLKSGPRNGPHHRYRKSAFKAQKKPDLMKNQAF
jgi:hypothetical protein